MTPTVKKCSADKVPPHPLLHNHLKERNDGEQHADFSGVGVAHRQMCIQQTRELSPWGCFQDQGVGFKLKMGLPSRTGPLKITELGRAPELKNTAMG